MPFDLFSKVFEHSVEQSDWSIAAREWKVTSENKVEGEGTCICGKQHIVYLSTIQNKLNGNILYPIGSECIKKFKNQEMDEQLKKLKKERITKENKIKRLGSTRLLIGQYQGITIEECCKAHLAYVKFVYTNHRNSKYKPLIAYANLNGIV